MSYQIQGYDEYEMAGLEQILGYDHLALGAARRPVARPGMRPASRPAPSMAAAIQAKQVQDGTLVRSSPPSRAQELAVGFPATSIAAAASANVTTNPQEIFRPERLVVGDAIAPNFIINSLIVGKNNQFLNQNPLPAEGFKSTAVGVRLRCDTAQVNSNIVLNVTNISLGTLTFYAMLVGTSVM